ncbi:MAG: YSIRK-type signal peptide-containing protein [Streptococcus vestibularis]|nr:YSIRK-type signal peptide-containing protein [Streptococcus vestibularis]
MWRITRVGKDLLNNCISRFSIRKLNVGVYSVLLGTWYW